MQAGHLFKGNAGLRQMQLSTGAKVTTLSVHGMNVPGNGKVVNLPANNKGIEHHEIEHREVEHRESEHHDTGHHEIGHNESQPHEHFERRQTSFNHFSNSQAHMGGMRGGGGMHLMGGGSGMHMMGGGGGGFGRRH